VFRFTKSCQIVVYLWVRVQNWNKAYSGQLSFQVRLIDIFYIQSIWKVAFIYLRSSRMVAFFSTCGFLPYLSSN